jgi:hypothetical protein
MRILSTQQSEDLLAAAESLAVELGGVRFITLARVTEREQGGTATRAGRAGLAPVTLPPGSGG